MPPSQSPRLPAAALREFEFPYLDLGSSHEQTDILVLLAGEQGYRVLPVLDLYAIDLDTENGAESETVSSDARCYIQHQKAPFSASLCVLFWHLRRTLPE